MAWPQLIALKASSVPSCSPPASPSPGFEMFTLPALLPNEHCSIAVRVHLCCDISAACATQNALMAQATIYPFLIDECNHNYADNVLPFTVKPCCSHDPNDCTVSPVGCGPQGFINRDQALTYLVQFQ